MANGDKSGEILARQVQPRPSLKEPALPTQTLIADTCGGDRPLVIGIGASAGGLDAIKAFFAAMPSDSRVAFVLVFHHCPYHSSVLPELIAKQTVMSVSTVEDGMPVRPGRVFITPTDCTLTIREGSLHIERPMPPGQNHHPIDTFFTSLAENQGENAVGIVLAGTGSDGSAGIRAIKVHGGLTLAQAGFDYAALSGMPQSAVATGQVDHVMQVSDMPGRLTEYVRHLKGVAALKDGDGTHRDLEDRFANAAIVEFSQDALISLTLDDIVRSWNPGAEHLFGYTAEEAIGKPITTLDGIDRDDKQSALIEQAKDGGVAGPVAAIWSRKRGEKIYVELTIIPIRGPNRVVTGLALSARNMAERLAADHHRALLLRELSHRVKNALATVQAVATQTLKTARTPEVFAASFSARLMALARMHDLLVQGDWQGASLQDVVSAELAPYQSESNASWRCDGPAIQLDAKTALALGMAFHELATNAAKHGAVSVPSGRIDISWERQVNEGGRRLRLLWVERGGPAVQRSRHKGFGTRLIGDGLAYELNGEVSLEFKAAGVRCTIDIPLSGQEARQ